MIEIEIPFIGKVKLTENDKEYEYFNDELIVKGKKIEFDIHFKEVDKYSIEKSATALNKLEEIMQISNNAIIKDFNEKGDTEYYINEWNNEIFEQIFSSEEFEDFIEDTDSKLSIEKRLLNKLQLVRIGIYVYSENDFLTLDYAFGKKFDKGFRDDMLVVKLNQNLDVTEITNEG